MASQTDINFKRITEAIGFIRDNFRSQPDLEEIAQKVHLSPAYFHRLFTEWAGISPKKFLQYVSLENAKKIISDELSTLSETTYDLGFSSTSRLHDLFVKIEGMSPSEYKNGGKNLKINYNFYDSPFGTLVVASTEKGICHLAFEDDRDNTLKNLVRRFPKAEYSITEDEVHQKALQIFTRNWDNIQEIKLHLKGTEFQLKVWELLLKIPLGRLTTYGQIAQLIENPNASRAVGTAIGNNPIAYLIPCHRVIQSSGVLGDYMWGASRKTAIIGWEIAKIDNKIDS